MPYSIRTRVFGPSLAFDNIPTQVSTVQYFLSLLSHHASSVLVLLLSICYGLRLPVHLFNRVCDHKKDMGRYGRGMPIYYLPPFLHSCITILNKFPNASMPCSRLSQVCSEDEA